MGVTIHLDFETRCLADLKKIGLANYVSHWSFEVLLTGVAIGDQAPVVYPGAWPGLIELAESDENHFHAFNAPFERAVCRAYGIDIPLERWHCTKIRAHQLGFSGSLGDIGEQVGLSFEESKLSEGSRLVTKFCKPRRSSKRNPELFWSERTAPEEWARFVEYCRQDVAAERAIFHRLERWSEPESEEERGLWCLDQRINGRGLPIDVQMVQKAVEVGDQLTQEANDTMRRLTGVSASQVKALTAWAQARGYTEKGLSAESIESFLERGEEGVSEELTKVLRLRLAAAQSAVSKFSTILDQSHDGRVHGAFQLRGASRTGRWSGRAVQPQNLKRPTMKDPGAAADLLTENPELFKRLYTLEDLGSLVRSSIAPLSDRVLAVADLANIESRVLGWMTGCRSLNETFAKNLDPYRAFGVRWLGVPYEELTKEQRNFCKPPSLGCGYGLGPVGLAAYADSMGIHLDSQQCVSAVGVFRSDCHEVPAFWRNIERAFVLATKYDAEEAVGPFFVQRKGDFVRIRLPSGRWLWYHNPRVDDGQIYYWGVHQKTRQWCELATWGGKLCENLDQAVAADILAVGLRRADIAGLQVVGHVHDEIILEELEVYSKPSLDMLISCMTDPVSWAPGLILKASGYTSPRYRKD